MLWFMVFGVAAGAVEPVPIHRVDPTWPRTFGGPSVGEVTCDVALKVAPDGTLAEAQVSGCPVDFALAVRAVLPQWRWVPYRWAEGQPLAATTLALGFADPVPRAPPYRDFMLGGGVRVGGAGVVGQGRLRVVVALGDRVISPTVGLDAGLRGGAPIAGEASGAVGASVGGVGARVAVSAGLGGRTGAGPFVPIEMAGQAEAGPVRLHGRAALGLGLRRGAGRTGELALGATWKVPSAFEPRFGPRLDLALQRASDTWRAAVTLGLGL